MRKFLNGYYVAARAQSLGESIKRRLSLRPNISVYNNSLSTHVSPGLRGRLRDPSENPLGNAFIHAYGAAQVAVRFGANTSSSVLNSWETIEAFGGIFGSIPNVAVGAARYNDLNAVVFRRNAYNLAQLSNTNADHWNNAVGFVIARVATSRGLSENQIPDVIAAALKSGMFAVVPNYIKNNAGSGLAGPAILLPYANRAFDFSIAADQAAFKALLSNVDASISGSINQLISANQHVGALNSLAIPGKVGEIIALVESGTGGQILTFQSNADGTYSLKLTAEPMASSRIGRAIGQMLGSALGDALAKSETGKFLSSTIMGAIGQQLGGYLVAGNSVLSSIGQSISDIIDLRSGVTLSAFAGAAIGSVSSFLTLEFADALGLDGELGSAFGSTLQTVIDQVISNRLAGENLLKGFTKTSEFFNGWKADGTQVQGPGQMLGNALGAFLGAKLGSLVVAPQTLAGARLASLGTMAGSWALGSTGLGVAGNVASILTFGSSRAASWIAANILAPGVGAFVGFIVGALIGNLFGKKKQRIPSAFADAVLNVGAGRFELGTTSVSNGGNIELARNMATITQETLNGIIETIASGQKLRSVWSGSQGSLTARFGHTNDQLWVNMGWAGNTNVTSADEAVDKAVLWALPNLQIAGGNMFLKRAVARSQATSVAVLSGDMQIAEDYGFYLQNRAVIDAAIAEPYTSMKLAAVDYLSYVRINAFQMYKDDPANADPQGKDLAKIRAWGERKIAEWGSPAWVMTGFAVSAEADSNFYDANKAFMTRALAKDSVPLDNVTAILRPNGQWRTDEQWYSDNNALYMGQVDRIISRLALTQFAASWIITLQRAAELKINQASASDFFGGAQGFADSLKLMSSAGDTPGFYDELRMTMQPDGTTLRAEYLSGGNNRVRGADLSRGDAFVHTWWDGGSGAGVTRSIQTIDGERAMVLTGTGGYYGSGATYSGAYALNGGDRSDGWYSVQAGQRVGFSMDTFNPGGSARVDAHVHFWAADGTALGYQTGAYSDPNALGWQKLAGVVTAPAGAAYAGVVLWTLKLGYSVGVSQATTLRRFQVETLPAGATAVSDWSGSSYDSFDVSNFWSDVGYNQSGAWTYNDGTNLTLNALSDSGTNQFYNYSNWSANLTIKDFYQSTEWVVDPDYWDSNNGTWVSPGTGSYQTVTRSGGDDIYVTGFGADFLEGWGGNDWLDAGSGKDRLSGGEGDDVLLGRAGIDGLVGGNGNDYLSLGEGDDYTDWIDPLNGGAWGEGGDDTFSGGQGQDSMFGGDGNDTFIADEDSSWDWYDGGNGSDTVSYVKFTTAITYDLNVRAGWSWGPEARTFMGDGLNLIENITGTNFNDSIWGDEIGNVLKGGYGDDNLYGRIGDDTLEGGQGADKLHGEDGTDTASYEGSQAAVWVDLTATAENLWAGEGFGGDAEGDTYVGIESIKGSALSDTLKGHAGYNLLIGGRGDDWFTATWGGDRHEGGEGFDTVDFADLTWGAAANLASGIGGGSASGMTFAGIEHLAGTAFEDHFTGSSRDETFSGGKGNDTLAGDSGNDTYVLNIGDGNDTIVDDANGSNALVFGEGVTWSMLSFNAPNQGLQMTIRGTGDGVWLDSNFSSQSGNNKIKTIDVGGSGGVEIGNIGHGRSRTSGNDIVYGNTNTSDWNWGYEGDDIIYGSGNEGFSGTTAATEQHSNVIVGGEGNDLIYTSAGDDTFVFERGHGIDAIYDTGGRDRIVIGSTATMEDVIYKVVGSDLWVGLKDLTNLNLEAHQVADRIQIVNGAIRTWTGQLNNLVEHVVAGGAEIDFSKLDIAWAQQQQPSGGGGGGGGNYNLPPIVFDLGDDGVDLVSVNDSKVSWRDDATGKLFRVGWVDGDDGILALDRDGDGAITKLSEISFVRDLAGAKTDLEGLRAFDTNKDSIFDAKDARFGDFKVWRDINQNGRGRGKELQSLAEAGITSIDLKLTATGFDGSNTSESTVVNTASFTWADGRTGTANDVFLKMQWAHIKGNSASAGALDLTGVGNEGEFGRVKGKGNKATEKAVGYNEAIPTQDLDFIKADAGDGQQNLKKVVKKNRTFKDRDDAAKAAAANGGLAGSAGTAAPLVIDLGGDGIDLIEADKSSVWFDLDEDGWADRLGWAGKGEGILALDRDLDGLVQPLSEISFTADLPGAKTDLEGLKAFDSNNDDWLASDDVQFGNFMIWTDADQNGQSSYEELMTLDQAGISKIALFYLDGPMRSNATVMAAELITSDMPASLEMTSQSNNDATMMPTDTAQRVNEGDLTQSSTAQVSAAAVTETQDLANTKNTIFGHAEVHFKDGRVVKAADAAFGSINGLSIDPLASSAEVAKTASTNPYEALDFGQPWSLNASQRRKLMEGLRDQGGPPEGFDDFMMGDDGTEYGPSTAGTSVARGLEPELLDAASLGTSDALPGSQADIAPAADVFAAITSARSLTGLADSLAGNDANQSEQTSSSATTRAIKRWWTDPAAGVQAFRSTLAGKGDTLPDMAALASKGTPASQASGALMSSADAASARQNQAFAQAITQFKSPSRMSGTSPRPANETNQANLAPSHTTGAGLSKSRAIATGWG